MQFFDMGNYIFSINSKRKDESVMDYKNHAFGILRINPLFEL